MEKRLSASSISLDPGILNKLIAQMVWPAHYCGLVKDCGKGCAACGTCADQTVCHQTVLKMTLHGFAELVVDHRNDQVI